MSTTGWFLMSVEGLARKRWRKASALALAIVPDRVANRHATDEARPRHGRGHDRGHPPSGVASSEASPSGCRSGLLSGARLHDGTPAVSRPGGRVNPNTPLHDDTRTPMPPSSRRFAPIPTIPPLCRSAGDRRGGLAAGTQREVTRRRSRREPRGGRRSSSETATRRGARGVGSAEIGNVHERHVFGSTPAWQRRLRCSVVPPRTPCPDWESDQSRSGRPRDRPGDHPVNQHRRDSPGPELTDRHFELPFDGGLARTHPAYGASREVRRPEGLCAGAGHRPG